LRDRRPAWRAVRVEPLPGRCRAAAGQKGHGRGACRGARRIRSGGLDRPGGRGRLAPL